MAPTQVSPDSLSTSQGEQKNSRFWVRLQQIPACFYALFAGILGLGLATIPSIAMDRPFHNPFSAPIESNRATHESVKIDEPLKKSTESAESKKSGATLKIRGFSIKVRKDPPKAELNPIETPKVSEPSKFAVTNDPVRWFTIAACISGMVGIVLAAVAHYRKQHNAITVTALACSVAALVWQYVLFGIVAGVAIVIVIVFLKFIVDIWGFDSILG